MKRPYSTVRLLLVRLGPLLQSALPGSAARSDGTALMPGAPGRAGGRGARVQCVARSRRTARPLCPLSASLARYRAAMTSPRCQRPRRRAVAAVGRVAAGGHVVDQVPVTATGADVKAHRGVR